MRTILALLVSCLLTSAYAAVSTNGNQTVALSANATLIGTAPAGHGVQWRVKSVPPTSACNFPNGGANETPATTQNPTTALFSHTGTYVLTFTDTTDSSSADVTITVVKNSNGDGTVSKNRVVRIMPLGDSITAESGPGWRWGLQDKLSASGYQFDFVGGRHLGTNGSYDPDHEGHSGWETHNYPFSQEFGWGIDNGGYTIDTDGLQPDLVLLMFGTNDAGRGGQTSAQSAARLFQIVDDIFAKVPASRVIVARIPRLSELYGNEPAPSGGVTKAVWIENYNTNISTMGATRVGAGQKLSVVDMYGALSWADLSDGVHPNAGGYAKMAQVWYDGIVAVTSGGGGGGNQPPTVSMATPTGPFTAPATVNLSATATDSDGSVAKVEFFNGDIKLGEDTSAPYTYSWTSVAAGTYSVTAKATDNQGTAITSSGVSVTVDAAGGGGGGLPPGTGERTGQVGGQHYWLPDLQTIRGMLCTGINPDTQALARKWGFGILYTDFGGAENSPGYFAEIGTQTGHLELTGSTPFIAFGLSTSGGFVTKLAETYADQMIAFVGNNTAFCYDRDNLGWNWNRPIDMDPWKVSIVDITRAKKVAGLFVMSELDSAVGIAKSQLVFESARRQNAPWTFVVLPGLGHSGYVLPVEVYDWCDRVIANRYPLGSSLGAVNRSNDWYGNLLTKYTASSAAYSGEQQTASWLPDAAWATAWAGLTKGVPYTLAAMRAKILPRGIIDESSIQIAQALSNLPANDRLWPSANLGCGPWDNESTNPDAQQHATGKMGRWKLCADLQVGDQITPWVLPDATAITSLPASVRGCDYLRPAFPVKESRPIIASFRLAQAAEVTIALDDRVTTPPDWMAGFTKVTGEAISIYDGTTAFESPRVLNLFRRSLPANATVEVGGNGYTGEYQVLMYLVIVKASGPQANQAPSVSAGSDQTVSLANGSASITLNAAVSDDGQVQAIPTLTWTSDPSAGVSFTNPTAAGTTATFTGAGTYTLTLRAFDGALSNTDTLTVTVNAAGSNLPPTVTQTAPGNGAYATAPANVMLTAIASDSDGTVTKVEFFNGAVKLGEDSTAPYEFAWTGIAVGSYSLSAKAIDNQGAITTSATATVSVGTDIVLQAENHSAKYSMTDAGALMGGATSGSWLRFDNVPLASATYVRFSVSYQGNGDTGVLLTVRQGSSTGTVLATLTTAPTSGTAFTTQSVAFTSPGSTQTLYVVFAGGIGAAYYDWFRIDTTSVGGGGGGSADSIAVNLGDPAMGASVSAGVVATTNWTTIASPSATILADGSGTTTTASHSFSSPNWGPSINEQIPDNVGNERMLRGCFDQTEGITHSLNGIPFAGYDLYLYFDRSNVNIRTFVHTFTITDDTGAILAGPFYARDVDGAAFAGFVEVPTTSTSDQQNATPAGNYLRLRGLSAANIRIRVGAGNESWGQDGFSRSALGGFQLVRTAAAKLGDVNGDGTANSVDLAVVKGQFGRVSSDTGFNSTCDLNGDGRVDAVDLAVVIRNQDNE